MIPFGYGFKGISENFNKIVFPIAVAAALALPTAIVMKPVVDFLTPKADETQGDKHTSHIVISAPGPMQN